MGLLFPITAYILSRYRLLCLLLLVLIPQQYHRRATPFHIYSSPSQPYTYSFLTVDSLVGCVSGVLSSVFSLLRV